jgi:Ca2+-binding RTX toxin-like protein
VYVVRCPEAKKEEGMRGTTLLFVALIMAMTLGFSGTAVAANLKGTEGPDAIEGTARADSISGLGDNDALAGDPSLFGIGGADKMSGASGNDAVYGRSGRDAVAGGPGGDDVRGTLGADAVYGGEGDDVVHEGPPFDSYTDWISGGPGNDLMDAYNRPAHTDFVVCGSGSDAVYTDGTDRIARDCEKVIVGPPPAA